MFHLKSPDKKFTNQNLLSPNTFNPNFSRNFFNNSLLDSSINEKSDIFTCRTPITNEFFDYLTEFDNSFCEIEEDFEMRQIDEHINILVYSFLPPRFIPKTLMYKDDIQEEVLSATRLNSNTMLNEKKQNDDFSMLVIDQDWFFLQATKLFMIGQKIKIETTSSEENALKIIDDKQNIDEVFNMILIECKGQTAKGPINIRILKEKIKKYKKVPLVIGYTESNEEIYHQQLKRAGVDQIIAKPIKLTKLMKFIDSIRKVCT